MTNILKYLQLTFEGYKKDYNFIEQDKDNNANYYMADSNVLDLVLKPWDNTHLIHITKDDEIKKYIAYFLAINLTQYIKENSKYVSILPYHADEVKMFELNEYLNEQYKDKVDIAEIVKEIESKSNDLEKIEVIAERMPKLYETLIFKNRYKFKINQLKAINKLRHIAEIAPQRDYEQPFDEILEYLKERESLKSDSNHTDESLKKDAKAIALLKYINEHNEKSRYILITADNNLLSLTTDTKYENIYSQFIRKIDTIAPFLAENRLEKGEKISNVAKDLSIITDKNGIRNLDNNFEDSILKKFVDIIDYVGIETYVKELEAISLDEIIEIIKLENINKALEQKISDIKNEFVDALAWTPEALEWIDAVKEGKTNQDDPSARLPLPYECRDKNNQEILDELYDVLYRKSKITNRIIEKIFSANSRVIKVATMIVQIANEKFEEALKVLEELKKEIKKDKEAQDELELFEVYIRRHIQNEDNFNELYSKVENLASSSKQKLELIAIRVLSAYNELLCKKENAQYTNNNSLENDIYQALDLIDTNDTMKELQNRIILNALSYLMYLRIKNDLFKIEENKIYKKLLSKLEIVTSLENDTNFYRQLMLLYWKWEQDKDNKKSELLTLIDDIIKANINKIEFKNSYKYKRLEKLKDVVSK